jgi:hypothetical protein
MPKACRAMVAAYLACNLASALSIARPAAVLAARTVQKQHASMQHRSFATNSMHHHSSSPKSRSGEPVVSAALMLPCNSHKYHQNFAKHSSWRLKQPRSSHTVSSSEDAVQDSSWPQQLSGSSSSVSYGAAITQASQWLQQHRYS